MICEEKFSFLSSRLTFYGFVYSNNWLVNVHFFIGLENLKIFEGFKTWSIFPFIHSLTTNHYRDTILKIPIFLVYFHVVLLANQPTCENKVYIVWPKLIESKGGECDT